MNIYMYTVYTYLSVDIYECTSNVSITCRYRRYVLSPFIYHVIFVYAPPFFAFAADYMCTRTHVWCTCKVKCAIVMFLITIVQKGFVFFPERRRDAEACNHRVFIVFFFSFFFFGQFQLPWWRLFIHTQQDAGGRIRWMKDNPAYVQLIPSHLQLRETFTVFFSFLSFSTGVWEWSDSPAVLHISVQCFDLRNAPWHQTQIS